MVSAPRHQPSSCTRAWDQHRAIVNPEAELKEEAGHFSIYPLLFGTNPTCSLFISALSLRFLPLCRTVLSALLHPIIWLLALISLPGVWSPFGRLHLAGCFSYNWLPRRPRPEPAGLETKTLATRSRDRFCINYLEGVLYKTAVIRDRDKDLSLKVLSEL